MRFIALSICLVLMSCDNAINTNNTTASNTNAEPAPVDSSQYPADEFREYADMYILVSYTSTDYYSLQTQMYNIHKDLSLAVDTLGRYYDTVKKKIIVPEDDEDEIYAGEYIYRRYGEDFLSIEYMQSYDDEADSNEMGIVAGIFEYQHTSDSLSAVLRNKGYPVFVIKTNMYMGCMH